MWPYETVDTAAVSIDKIDIAISMGGHVVADKTGLAVERSAIVGMGIAGWKFTHNRASAASRQPIAVILGHGMTCETMVSFIDIAMTVQAAPSPHGDYRRLGSRVVCFRRSF